MSLNSEGRFFFFGGGGSLLLEFANICDILLLLLEVRYFSGDITFGNVMVML